MKVFLPGQITPLEVNRNLVSTLPESRTGLGLERSRVEMIAAVDGMSPDALRMYVALFCDSWEVDDTKGLNVTYSCACGAVAGDARVGVVEAHSEVEELGLQRLACFWQYRHRPDEDLWFGDVHYLDRLEELKEFD